MTKLPNWDYFSERLEDRKLLTRAVPIVCDGMVLDLGVPLGGTRLGGHVLLPTLRFCREAVRQLKHLKGFPHLRIIKVDGGYPHRVEWGEPEPDTEDEAVIGRHYGYSEVAIAKFVTEHAW